MLFISYFFSFSPNTALALSACGSCLIFFDLNVPSSFLPLRVLFILLLLPIHITAISSYSALEPVLPYYAAGFGFVYLSHQSCWITPPCQRKYSACFYLHSFSMPSPRLLVWHRDQINIRFKTDCCRSATLAHPNGCGPFGSTYSFASCLSSSRT